MRRSPAVRFDDLHMGLGLGCPRRVEMSPQNRARVACSRSPGRSRGKTRALLGPTAPLRRSYRQPWKFGDPASADPLAHLGTCSARRPRGTRADAALTEGVDRRKGACRCFEPDLSPHTTRFKRRSDSREYKWGAIDSAANLTMHCCACGASLAPVLGTLNRGRRSVAAVVKIDLAAKGEPKLTRNAGETNRLPKSGLSCPAQGIRSLGLMNRRSPGTLWKDERDT